MRVQMRASFFFAHEPIDHDGQHFWCTTLEGPIGTETINNPPIVPAGFVRRDRPARGDVSGYLLRERGDKFGASWWQVRVCHHDLMIGLNSTRLASQELTGPEGAVSLLPSPSASFPPAGFIALPPPILCSAPPQRQFLASSFVHLLISSSLPKRPSVYHSS